jgi:hypothetical protein
MRMGAAAQRSRNVARLLGGLAVVAALAGCADPTGAVIGSSRADVLKRLGSPTSTYPLGAAERLQYSRAPAGTEVTNIDIGAGGQVVAVTQVLDEGRFPLDIQTDRWREADVLRTYGRPEEVSRVSAFDGTVWSWRYRQLNNPRLLYIYLDPQGVVRRWHTGDDLRYFNTPDGAGRE